MAQGRAIAIRLNGAERDVLTRNVRDGTGALALRSQIVLLAADGWSNEAIGRRVGVSGNTVSNWRRRFEQRRVAGLHDEQRPGRPPSIGDEQIRSVIRA